jgi:pyruvate,orthophosphate dikinase
MLQTRNGKRTARASLKIAVDLVENNVIDKETALMRIEPAQLDQLLHPTFDAEALARATKIAKGLPASPGAAVGKVYFTPKDAVEATHKGEKTILVRLETSPEDIEGMVAAEGIVTARGGMTSHAAVVARGMGKCCVAGCEEIQVFESKKMFKVGNLTFHEGDYISLDGNTGTIYQGIVPTASVEMTEDFQKIMQWADEVRRLKVRTNADTPKDALNAVSFGAEGIGLCRTEHMFFHEERIFIVRQMIMAQSKEKRVEALQKLLPYQKNDFVGIYKAMGERPVTIRLLDPPLHEFLPEQEKDMIELAEAMGMDVAQLNQVIVNLREVNPMLGHRGCRLAITYPEIYEMQVEAIIRAAIEVKSNENMDIKPEIMIPLIGSEEEIVYVKNVLLNKINAVLSEADVAVDYQIGTMIEVPRATLVADKIAKHAEFFSFGTNDLTQMTFGFSRDDAGKFIKDYTDKKILEKDPFERLDQEGVGRLMEFAIELGKKGRPDIKLGICGEHGGDPTTIEFCHRIGLDYVSCSPFRVPIARLAAAQAQIRFER